tara:strand:+ start:141 stop:323 length:183 start_codon:yes stop_codon:yes gene_type:complete
LTCRFIVKKNNAKKYNKRMGQKTGTSKILNNDMTIDMDTALTADNLKRERERERERVKSE